MSIYPPVRNDLVQLLSQPRLAAYRVAAGGNVDDALRLYAWNLQAGAAFLESIHYLEVALRNTMADALMRWATTLPGVGSTPWYRATQVPLTSNSRSKIAEAIRHATMGGRAETPGHVVAELSFGFWWSLLATEYNRGLWQPCLQHVFSRARRGLLHSSLNEMRELRNRIAHHEPIHARNLLKDYETLLDAAGHISTRLPWWIDTTSRVASMLDQRP